ncbi:MAG: hypothetical protein ABDK94_04110 [Atribacterota bacterium]
MDEDPVDKKIGLLEKILELTQAMQKELEDGVSETLLLLLDERGKLIREVEQCDQEIDFATLTPEDRERMLGLLRQIAMLNEDMNARLSTAIAAEKEAIVSMRKEQTFLQKVQENLPPSRGFDAGG